MSDYSGINFPDTPNLGDTFLQTVSGITYQYKGGDPKAVGSWKVIQTGQDSADVAIVDQGRSRYMEFDNLTRMILNMEAAHHRIHEGVSFTYRDVVTLASNGVQDYVIVTPSDRQCHFGYEVSPQLLVVIELFEAGDRTPTTVQTTHNRNRNMSNVAQALLYKGQSGGTKDGDRIIWRSEGSSAASSRSNVQVGEGQERILKVNTQYIFRITSGANSNVVSTRLSWYEHIND